MAPNTKASSKRRPKGVRLEQRYGQPEVNDSLALVEYHKKEETSFRIMSDDLSLRSQAHRSFDLMWQLSGYGTDANVEVDGTVLSLKHSIYTIENLSDHMIYMRLQRPLGYRESPTSIGAWEPLSTVKKGDLVVRLKPRTQRVFNVSNSATTHMCPRHLSREGKVYIHLMTFSFFRDVLNIHGNKVDPQGVVLKIGAETHFRVNDGKIGNNKGYYIETWPDSKRMDLIDPGPSTPIRIGDLNVNTSKGLCSVDNLFFNNRKVGNVQSVVMKAYCDSAQETNTGIQGLDVKAKWLIPPIIASFSGGHESTFNLISYESATSAWVLGSYQVTDLESVNASGIRFWAAEKIGYHAAMLSEQLLYPTTTPKGVKRSLVRCVTRKPSLLSPSVTGSLLREEGYEEITIETVLDSILVIVEVVRIVASFAAAVGFLEGDPVNVIQRPG